MGGVGRHDGPPETCRLRLKCITEWSPHPPQRDTGWGPVFLALCAMMRRVTAADNLGASDNRRFEWNPSQTALPGMPTWAASLDRLTVRPNGFVVRYSTGTQRSPSYELLALASIVLGVSRRIGGDTTIPIVSRCTTQSRRTRRKSRTPGGNITVSISHATTYTKADCEAPAARTSATVARTTYVPTSRPLPREPRSVLIARPVRTSNEIVRLQPVI